MNFRQTFKAFEYRDFRLQWAGACTSSIGTWMQKVAQSWLVYEMSGSAFVLGLDATLGEIPILLFSMVGGVVADRMDRRRLLIMSQVVQLVCAFALAFLLWMGMTVWWPILVLSFTVGCAQAFGGPAYQAMIPSLVKKEDLQNAIALNSIQFNLARVIGPLIGGLIFTKFGYIWCFLLNGLSYVAVIITLSLLEHKAIPAKTGESVLDSMKVGIRFIRSQTEMVSLIVIAFCMTSLGIPLLTFLPSFVKEVFHSGPQTFTNMLTVSGIGAVLGALVVAALGNVKNKGQVTLLLLAGLGVGITAFASSRSIELSYVVLFLTGVALIGCFAMIASLVQLLAPDEMRGRVMSVYNVAFRGGMPVGNFVTGALIGVLSAPVVLATYGIALLIVAMYFLLVHRKVAAI